MGGLLDRQLRRFGADGERPPSDWPGFLRAVAAAYEQSMTDRQLLERSMELASRELYERNQQLQREMQDRERMQAELRVAQKLESVGQLAAGIAHEINTPVQYIGDSVAFLNEVHADLSKFVESCRRVGATLRQRSSNDELADEIDAAAQAADLDYVTQEVPLALKRAQDGVERVTRIVRAMKEFAHPGQREMSFTDVNRSIRNTVVVATNEYKYTADLELALTDLPQVRCHAGELNQVLLNLIVNAAHAVADSRKGTSGRGRIRVGSKTDGPDVVITIADDGCGIPEAIRHRIFDPFFTTKEVGRGTGQGLAIARSIVVDRHRGQLTFQSEVGKGTTFTIRLPIEGTQDAAASAA
jgi:two-component system, NtrC family, sensor kinase